MIDTNQDSLISMEHTLLKVTFPLYRLCVDCARKFFKEESAIQSASATMFINVNQRHASEYDKMMKNRISKIDKDAVPNTLDTWKWIFRKEIERFGSRIVGQLGYCLNQCMTPEEIERCILEYVERLEREIDDIRQ